MYKRPQRPCILRPRAATHAVCPAEWLQRRSGNWGWGGQRGPRIGVWVGRRGAGQASPGAGQHPPFCCSGLITSHTRGYPEVMGPQGKCLVGKGGRVLAVRRYSCRTMDQPQAGPRFWPRRTWASCTMWKPCGSGGKAVVALEDEEGAESWWGPRGARGRPHPARVRPAFSPGIKQAKETETRNNLEYSGKKV